MPPKNNVNPDLDPVIADPVNRICADCDAKAPRWASVNLGILVCIDCSGAHRNLGTHISSVKSATLDKWQAKWIETVKGIGNEASNGFYEAQMGGGEKPRDADSLEKKAAFIRKKYEHKSFTPRNKPSPSELYAQGRKTDVYTSRGGDRDRSDSGERRRDDRRGGGRDDRGGRDRDDRGSRGGGGGGASEKFGGRNRGDDISEGGNRHVTARELYMKAQQSGGGGGRDRDRDRRRRSPSSSHSKSRSPAPRRAAGGGGGGANFS